MNPKENIKNKSEAEDIQQESENPQSSPKKVEKEDIRKSSASKSGKTGG